MRVARGGNDADRLVHCDVSMRIARLRQLDELAVDGDRVVFRIDARTELADHAAINGHAAFHDHVFGGPQCGHSRPGQHFVQTFKHIRPSRRKEYHGRQQHLWARS